MRIGQSAKVDAVTYVACLMGAAMDFSQLAVNQGKEQTAADWAKAFKDYLKGASFSVRPVKK